MHCYVLEEDKPRAQQLNEKIGTTLEEMIEHYEVALLHWNTGDYFGYLASYEKAEKARQEHLSILYELDELKAKRVHQERLMRRGSA